MRLTFLADLYLVFFLFLFFTPFDPDFMKFAIKINL